MTEPVDPDEPVEVSLMLRPRHSLQELDARPGQQPLSREEFAARYGADPSDMATVEDFARAHNLKVIEASQPRRTVRLAGRAADISRAFGVQLHYEALQDGTQARVPDRAEAVPDELSGIVQGVFGLDTRPVARHG
jgi:kumamolisin